MADPQKRPGRHTVEVDLYIARRKRLHAVRAPDGATVFHAPHVIDVLDFLTDNDIGQAEFADEDARYLVTFERMISPP